MLNQSRQKVVYGVGVAGVIVVFLALVLGLFDRSEPKSSSVAEPSAAPQTESLPESAQAVALAAPAKPVATNSSEPKDPSESPFFEKEAKLRLLQVAEQFAEDIKYPSYSKPIADLVELEKYLPNQSVPSELAVDSKDANSPRVSLRTSKHQYFVGEPILAFAEVRGLQGDSAVQVAGRVVRQGEPLASATGTSSDSAPYQFNMAFTLDSDLNVGINSVGVNNELRVIAQFNIDGRDYEIGTPITYVSNVAQVTDVGAAEVNDEYLQIPVYVSTTKLGYHEVSANLYSANTGKPLVHLSAQKELQTEHDVIPLQGHIVALKKSTDQGPYLLKDISLIRMPSPPDFTTEYGLNTGESYAVQGFAFSDYRDVPYVDEEAQERQDFLAHLGGKQ